MDTDFLETLRKKHPARITRAKAIKLYCKEICCCGDLESWKNCTQKSCFLWAFRQGKENLGNTTSFKKSSRKQRQNTSFLENPSVLETNADLDNSKLNGGLENGKM